MSTEPNTPNSAVDADAVAKITATVMTQVMSQFAEVLAKLKEPSPKEKYEMEQIEKLRERFARERKELQATEAQTRAEKERAKAACSHKYVQNGKTSISVVHNQYGSGGAPCGICMQCNDWIAPCHYEAFPPTVGTREEREQFLADLVAQSVTVPGSIPTRKFTGAKELVTALGANALTNALTKSGYSIGTPTNSRVEFVIVPEHRDYKRVLEQERSNNSGMM